MPISPIILQRRHAELGRIRLGRKGDKGQPQKLSQFRFTSPSESYIRDLAELYGGTPQPWDNNGKAEWEVFTTADSIPVIAVKNGLSQWMEYWQGGGCIHRCDGEVNVLTGDRCDLEEKVKTRVRGQDVWINPHDEAKPTTRLSLMLPELDAIGVFRLESHGWNAAAEIPAVAELAQHVGDLVPAVLHLVERRSVRDGKTSRFVVPVLDLRIGASRLREIAAEKSGLTQLAAPATTTAAAIEAPRPDYQAQADEITDLDTLGNLWRAAAAAGHLTEELKTYLTVRSNEIKAAAPAADAGEPVEAEIVPDSQPDGDADPDTIWIQIVTEGGRQGFTTSDLQEDFAQSMGGVTADSASAAELQHYLGILRGRGTEAVSA